MLHINKELLIDIHANHLQNIDGYNNNENTLKLVSVLGGIDNILHEYLKNESIQLNEDKLHQIHDIIEPQSQPTDSQHLHKIRQHQSKPYCENTQYCIELDEKETFLALIFKTETQSKILNAIHSTWLKTILLLSIATGIVLEFAVQDMFLYYRYVLAISIILWTPYFLFYALSVNRKAAKYICKTFEVWLKLYYTLHGFVIECMYSLLIDEPQTKQNKAKLAALPFMSGILPFLVIFIVSMFDGLRTDTKWKVLISGLIGAITIFYGVYYQFTSYSNGDQSIIHIYGNIAVSLNAMRINGFSIMALFLCKQAFLSFYKKDEEAAVSMKMTPIILWKHTQNIELLDKPRTVATI